MARSTVPRSRLETLSAGQLEELIGLLDDQWHALVRTDNLLGPRHALGGVRDQLGVIDTLLRTSGRQSGTRSWGSARNTPNQPRGCTRTPAT